MADHERRAVPPAAHDTMQALTPAHHDAWRPIDITDAQELSDFAIVAVTRLTDDRRRALGLPPLRLAAAAMAGPEYRMMFDPEQFEVVLPVAGAGGVSALYAVATPQRLVIDGGGGSIDLDSLRERLPWESDHRAAVGLFLVVEMALRSFRLAMRETRAALDEIEEELLDDPQSRQLVELNRLHRQVGVMRRSLSEYADEVDDANDTLETGAPMRPGVAGLARAHATSVQRVLAALSVVREEVTNMMELHRSMTASRQGEVINRLTVISALLLPLTFVTGFFGMNFAWLTESTESPLSFWMLGVAIPAAVAIVVVALMWRAGWLLVLQPSGDGASTPPRRSAERGRSPS